MALIGLHHDRKATTDDFVESISGTNGIAGAADTILVVNRPRNEPEGILSLTGRDVEEEQYGLKLIEGTWSLMGENLKDAARAARKVKVIEGIGERSIDIVEFIADHPEGVRAEDIVPLGFTPGEARVYLKRLYDSGRIARPKRGLYSPITSVTSVTNTDASKITPVTDVTGGSNAHAHAHAHEEEPEIDYEEPPEEDR
jgi:hypothetical protein